MIMGINAKLYKSLGGQTFSAQYVEEAFDGGVTLTIETVSEATLDGKPRLCVSFEKEPRRLPLNQGNLDTIIAAYGEDTDGWIGKPVAIGIASRKYKGRDTKGVEIRCDASVWQSKGKTKRKNTSSQSDM
jgi:hypothetical protein